jgi:chorismate synthase
MAANRFGNLFSITTWGESHGKAIGVVIDGCPAGLSIDEEGINYELALRRSGQNAYTSPRKEEDRAEIYSGIFEGKTTGAPISLIIFNRDARPEDYEEIKELLRPGHATYTYLEKYGIFDYRGGGRSSARETACRVAAGAVAKTLLKEFGIQLCAFVQEIGGIACQPSEHIELLDLKQETLKSPLFCPDPEITKQMIEAIESTRAAGDSLGGIVEVRASNLPTGLGDPVYEKLDVQLSKAFLSIPACKGFELGSGFAAARMKGSEHNDSFTLSDTGKVITRSNHAGGLLGGITSGMPLIARAAFKPPSSIRLPQQTLDLKKRGRTLVPPVNSRHDPCVTVRAVPVVEAMTALVLADALLMQRCARI